jgi:hypothetical protein
MQVIDQGVLTGLPRRWRLRVVDDMVWLEENHGKGLWSPVLALSTAPDSTQEFQFSGSFVEEGTDPEVRPEVLRAKLEKLNPGYKPRFARCLACGSTSTPAESMYCTSCGGQLTEDPVPTDPV